MYYDLDWPSLKMFCSSHLLGCYCQLNYLYQLFAFIRVRVTFIRVRFTFIRVRVTFIRRTLVASVLMVMNVNKLRNVEACLHFLT